MKIRNGFVSNSSSSSFLISAKDGEDPKIKIEIGLSQYVEDTLVTVKDVREYIKNQEFVDTDEEIDAEIESDNRYKKMLQAIDKGNVIYLGEVSDEMDDPISAMLCHNGLGEVSGGNFEVIQDCDGY